VGKIKVGLLGAGGIMKAHAKAVAACEVAELYAVCDVAVGRARAAATEFGITNVYGSIEELIASDCEAVHILLPPSLHIDMARRLVEAGKHVFVEKPFGPSPEECAAVTKLAEERGVALGVNHNFLFAPPYQAIRDAARSGTLGAIDHVTLNWLYELKLLQFGPFNNWMVASPGNLLFELASHLGAFAVDLLGPVEILAAVADNPLDLPGNQLVYRRWNAIGRGNRSGLTLNLSTAPGQTDRSISVRAMGGVAHFDFERGVSWVDEQSSLNPIIDNLNGARSAAKTLGRQAVRDFGRYMMRTLRKQAGGNPFEESIANSVDTFYRNIGGQMDPRLSGAFGTQVIQLCHDIVAKSAADQAGTRPRAPAVLPPLGKPRVLVVGGTGFIGKPLVKKLVEAGHGVRVVTRSITSASLDLDGLPVDLAQGSHGDPAFLDKALEGIDTVYHLAKAEGQRWADYVKNDIEPTRILGEAAVRHGVKRFIYTGTISSYSSDDPKVRITGDTPVDPKIAKRDLYGRSKAACEAVLQDLQRTKGLPLVIFRPGIVIGAGSPPAHPGVGNFVSATRVLYWGDGTNKIPLVLVDDVADALALALDAPAIDGESFLLTDKPFMSARDYVAEVEAYAGGGIVAETHPIWRYFLTDLVKEGLKNAIRHPNRRSASYHDWGSRAHRSIYDSSKTIERLGWKPAGSREALVERGIKAAVDRFMR
jgi:predicted dehydrogenase/nucleoside-diphosphate-sugar epimerase